MTYQSLPESWSWGKSCLGKKWHVQPIEERRYHHFLQQGEYSEILCRLLAQKNVSIDEASFYLNPKLKKILPHPFTLHNLEKAAQRLCKAFLEKEKVIVFGDYDVDGGCASALLVNFFKALDFSVEVYIPDRQKEGYGPSPEIIKKLHKGGGQLVVMVDCGSTAETSLTFAEKLGLDVIILDHHLCEKIPAYRGLFLVNPNQVEDRSHLGDLCATGVTFFFLMGLSILLKDKGFEESLPNLLHFLDLVALATVCDVMPLTGVNRAFVTQGLKILQKGGNKGLSALKQKTGYDLDTLSTYHLGFIFGPRLNAGGRLADSSLAVRLLTTEDEEKIEKLAVNLIQLNHLRQEVEQQVLQAALDQIHRENLDQNAVICVGDRGWHQGVIGIVAGRLKDLFEKPVCVVSFSEKGVGKGSGRSVSELHLGNVILEGVTTKFLQGGGGHSAAVGFTVLEKEFANFRNFLNENSIYQKKAVTRPIHLVLDPEAVTQQTVLEIEKMGPFGCGNPAPMVMLPNIYCDYIQVRGGKHLSCRLKSRSKKLIEAISFRSLDTPLEKALTEGKKSPMNLVGTLKLETWKGRQKVLFCIEDCLQG